MATNIKDIKNELNKAALDSESKNLQSGCCKITFGGSTTKKSGISQNQCKLIASKFPGASYSFTPGVSCS